MTHSPKILTTAAALLAGALAFSACGSDSGGGQGTSSATGSSTTAASTSATTTAASSSATSTGATGTATPAAGPHNQADVTFATEMIPHHEQAVEMSDILLGKTGIDAKVTDLAKEIKAAQAPEIAQMRGWLAGWDATSSSPSSGHMSGAGTGHMSGAGTGRMSGPGKGHSCMGHDCMGGMMSEADMAAFQAATGADAQRKFLTGMIKHHEGAVVMAQTELAQGQNPTAKQLAQEIIDAQKAEIAQMQKLLAG